MTVLLKAAPLAQVIVRLLGDPYRWRFRFDDLPGFLDCPVEHFLLEFGSNALDLPAAG